MNASSPIQVAAEDPTQPEVVALLRDGESFSAALYPAESNHHLAIDALREPNVRFFVARNHDRRPIGTGALVLNDGWGEIKSMWIVPEVRGLGVSKVIMAAIEAEALIYRLNVLRLETGIENHAALGLYARAGFERCGPYGDYKSDPLSVFMEKRVSETH